MVIPLSPLVVVKHPSIRLHRASRWASRSRWRVWHGEASGWDLGPLGHGRRHAAGPSWLCKSPIPHGSRKRTMGYIDLHDSMTGWFFVDMLVNIPAAWSIWDFQRNWLHHRIGSTWAHVWKVNITCLESDFWAHIPPIKYHVKMQEMDT